MTTYKVGERVHIRGNPGLVGTITADVDPWFPMMRGVQWSSGDFAFVDPHHLEHVATIPGLPEHERAELADAHRRALETVKAEPDWKTRAETAEALAGRVRALHQPLHMPIGNGTGTVKVCGACGVLRDGYVYTGEWPCATDNALKGESDE